MPSVRVLEASQPTFWAGAVDVTPAATPTDLVTLKGAVGKIIKLRRVVISGIATTAGQMTVSLIKRTAANTGGTTTVPTSSQGDQDGNAGAVLAQYSANPSGLGAGKTIRSRRVFLNLATAQLDRVEFLFGKDGGKSPVLRGVNEFFAINLGGGAVPAGGKIDWELEWTE